SGKTRTLTSRVVDLIVRRQVSPFNIAVVTFTKKAASDMKNRIRAFLGGDVANSLNIGTFHAVCKEFLNTHGTEIGLPQKFTTWDRNDSERYMHEVLASSDIRDALEPFPIYKKHMSSDDFLTFISRAKAKNLSPESLAQLCPTVLNDNVEKAEDPRITVYREYERRRHANNALDFDDLLMCGLKAVRQCPNIAERMHHVLVDEFQDTSPIQLDIVTALCSIHNRLTIVGDPDQSIYTFYSAHVTNLKRIQELFPQHFSVHLEESYRSASSILAGASRVISNNRLQMKTALFTSIEGGHPIIVHPAQSAEEEAAFVANEITRLIEISKGLVQYGDVAILVRAQHHAQALKIAFAVKQIPHMTL
ncbi:P-loop containing nucleoside triphosphate hydrolase protein, partial [Catenaria anguillulae PL171]